MNKHFDIGRVITAFRYGIIYVISKQTKNIFHLTIFSSTYPHYKHTHTKKKAQHRSSLKCYYFFLLQSI